MMDYRNRCRLRDKLVMTVVTDSVFCLAILVHFSFNSVVQRALISADLVVFIFI